MNKIFENSRISLSIFIILTFLGLLSLFTMPKEEDPTLKDRNGSITVVYPGATAEAVARLIVEPLEKELSIVSEIKEIDSTARSEFAYIRLTIKNSVSTETDIDQAWDEVKTSIDKAKRNFPELVKEPVFDRDLFDQDAIVISITGGDELGRLDYTQRLEKKISTTPLVAEVRRIAYPGENIRIEPIESALKTIGIDYFYLFNRLRDSNLETSSGAIKKFDKKLTVRTNTSFKSLNEIKRFKITLPSGEKIRLSEIAKVKKTPQTPIKEIFRWNGEEGITLGVVPQKKISLITFGEEVKKTLDNFKTKNSEFKVNIISFQPGNVKARLFDLGNSLIVGVLIIAIALFLLMGFRISLITVILVPSISLIALFVFSFIDGILQQISIAAFIVALGLLVDNVIVVIEEIQNNMQKGLESLEAAKVSVKSLLLPLGAATGTTIGAFVPMLGARGSAADFTRSIPFVVCICLLVSFVVAIFITPISCIALLKKDSGGSWEKAIRVFEKIGHIPFKHPFKICFITGTLFIISILVFTQVNKKFFPNADRNQLVLDIRLPEGTHFDTTKDISIKIEESLKENYENISVANYVGRGTPFFFYNLNRVPNSPHISQMILIFKSALIARNLKFDIQNLMDKTFPEAMIIVRSLAQGPPTEAPVQLRILGDSLTEIKEATRKLTKILTLDSDTKKIRSTLGVGVPVLNLEVNDSLAGDFGISRSVIASSLYSRTRGLEVGKFKYGLELFPIILGSRKQEDLSLQNLGSIPVIETKTITPLINQFTSQSLSWEPSVIKTYNRRLSVDVFSELGESGDPQSVVARILSKIKKETELSNVDIVVDGEVAESAEANLAILTVIPLGLLLLIVSLLLQFNSYKKVFVVMGALVPIPLGVFPGLWSLDLSFGFFTLLAILSLTGIVLNNGILIVDRIDSALREGLDLDKAIVESVKQRLRPIILTTVTTVLGLLPLAFSDATLWPPFAWSLIFGLIASMCITPLLVPALYKIIIGEKNTQSTEVLIGNS